MSAAALIALVHDLMLTIGIYALVGFTVTPATLIGLLTILGYSLYDTVVVFDKVRENVRDIRSSTTRTYSEAANLAVNQVLVRSINTTVIGVLPVAALLFAGRRDLGRGPAEGPGPGTVRRHGLRRVLLDLHRHTAAGPDQGARARDEEAGRAGPRTPCQGEPEGPCGRDDQPSTAAERRRRHDRRRGRRTEQRRTEEASSAPAGNGAKRSAVTRKPDVRPHSDGAAKRPQPQNKPRSQRKK